MNHRKQIQQLKDKNAELRQQLKEACQENSGSAERVWLENQIRTFKLKADQEQELAHQIQQELDNIRQQLKQPSASQQQQPLASRGNAPVSSSKQLVILEERLAHQRQRLDTVLANNHALNESLKNVAKRTQSAQSKAQQLTKQLSSVQSEAASVQDCLAAVDATQQQAKELAELLLSQDDAEHLALSAVVKQVAGLQLQLQEAQPQAAAAPSLLQSEAARPACSCTEAEAQAVLDQLCCLLQRAGAPLDSDCLVDGEKDHDGDEVEQAHWESTGLTNRRNEQLAMTLLQIEGDNLRLFQQCSLANWLQGRQHSRGQ